MRRHLLISFFLLPLSGCGAHVDPGSKYLALGDSYTCGQSVPQVDSYPFQLAAKLKATGDNLGTPTIVAVTGWTTDDLTAGIDAATLKPTYDLVTLLIGVNDQYQHRSVEKFRSHFVDLVHRAIGFAGGRTGHVIVISIPDWGVTPFAHGADAVAIGRDIDAFNDVVKIESTKAGVRWVDVTGLSRSAATQPTMEADDGLHPSGRQYGQWVDAIAPLARRALMER